MDIDKAWHALNRYFDAMSLGDRLDIANERNNFKYWCADKKIHYFGQNIELARQLVNKKLLVIEKR